jgi:hypothetical protein
VFDPLEEQEGSVVVEEAPLLAPLGVPEEGVE